jgi:hypothetical protein
MSAVIGANAPIENAIAAAAGQSTVASAVQAATATNTVSKLVTNAGSIAAKVDAAIASTPTTPASNPACSFSKSITDADRISIAAGAAENEKTIARYTPTRTTVNGIIVRQADGRIPNPLILPPTNPTVPVPLDSAKNGEGKAEAGSKVSGAPGSAIAIAGEATAIGAGSIPIVLLVGLGFILLSMTAAGGLRR